jgi:hypothetical protein
MSEIRSEPQGQDRFRRKSPIPWQSHAPDDHGFFQYRNLTVPRQRSQSTPRRKIGIGPLVAIEGTGELEKIFDFLTSDFP